MQTEFSSDRLSDSDLASAASAIRRCVHCGFCLATCPTYALLGDERDSPRGRIYLMKDMLENERTPTAETVIHIDRCLSCLSCTTTCPSDVNYAHLIDHARAYVERTYKRPFIDRFIRTLLANVLPYPNRFRFALRLGKLFRPLAPVFERIRGLAPFGAALRLAAGQTPSRAQSPTVSPISAARGNVILMRACAESVLRPNVESATLRFIDRLGYRVRTVEGQGCCGALTQHMGKTKAAKATARAAIDAWTAALDAEAAEAILITASGCGSSIKHYADFFRDDPVYAAKAARVAALARDVTEWLTDKDMGACTRRDVRIAYQAPCSLQHGQRIADAPVTLLKRAAFDIRTPIDAHLCCGSAGVYNILQPTIAGALRARKLSALDALGCDVIATCNIGCAVHLGAVSKTPVVHVVELLDWATGGPQPFEVRDDGALT